MSCDFGDSESSSESDFSFNEDFSLCNDLSKLKPYSFEPLVSSSSSDENEDTDDGNTRSVEMKEINDDNIIETRRIGNIDWCLCKCCKSMDSEAESLCCQETNEIPEEFFQGS